MNTLLFDLDRADIAASTADQRETGAVNILNIAAVPTNQRGMFFFILLYLKSCFIYNHIFGVSFVYQSSFYGYIFVLIEYTRTFEGWLDF